MGSTLYQYQILDTDPEAFDDLTRLAISVEPVALVSLLDA